MKPSTHTLRVALAAYKDRGMLTAAELEHLLRDAGCSKHSWEHEVRPELRRAGILRQSRNNGNVVWLIVSENIPRKASRLRDRYLAEQRAERGEPLPPSWKSKYRYGSPKWLREKIAREAQIDAEQPREPPQSTETPEQEKRRLEQIARCQRYAEEQKPAPRWTGPNIDDVSALAGSPTNSLSVPR